MFGISIYPEKTNLNENINYINLAGKYGFKRIFTTLLSVENKSKQQIIQEYKSMFDAAHQYGMHITIDVAPSVFSTLNISYDDLSFFKELGADCIRLDEGFDGLRESLMTYNKEDLDIEINMSNHTKYLDNIISFNPNKNKLLGCFNFYPQEYTGLDYNHFLKCCYDFVKHNIKTAAFVSCGKNKIGPWPINDGLVTIELHRNLDLITQIKDLLSLNLIDDIIVGDCYLDESQMIEIQKLNTNIVELKVNLNPNNNDLINQIILDTLHFNRGDISSFLIRSTQTRVKYKNESIPPVSNETKSFEKGDVVICNDNFKNYKGELQIIKLPQKNTENRRMLVGKIDSTNLLLIDKIKPWSKFKLVK